MALEPEAAPGTPMWHPAPRAAAACVSRARRGGRQCPPRGTAPAGAAGPGLLAAEQRGAGGNAFEIPIRTPCLRGAYCGSSRCPPVRRTPGHMQCSATVRYACGCLSRTDARCCLRQADCTTHTVDLGMRIVHTCPELASSVSSWSSCGKEWTERYKCDASFSTLLFSRTTLFDIPGKSTRLSPLHCLGLLLIALASGRNR